MVLGIAIVHAISTLQLLKVMENLTGDFFLFLILEEDKDDLKEHFSGSKLVWARIDYGLK